MQVLQDTDMPSNQVLLDDNTVTRHSGKGHTATYICAITKIGPSIVYRLQASLQWFLYKAKESYVWYRINVILQNSA